MTASPPASPPFSLPSLPAPLVQRPRGLARIRFWAARLVALARGRCPRCLEGRIFGGAVAMNEKCPSCGLQFGREPGYFFGAMYFGYAQGIVGIVGFLALFSWLLPAWSWNWTVVLATVAFLPFSPGAFRRSRAIWLHFDQFWDPR